MNTPIKVLHVVGRMDQGGTETLLMNLLRTVDKQQFQFDIVEQTQDRCDHDGEILRLGSEIYRCPHISPLNLRQYRKWWRDFFRDHPEYQIVHGHSRGSAPIYLDEANRAGRITIAHCHNNSHGRGLKGLIRYLWQIPLRRIGQYNFACSYDSGISQFGKKRRFEVMKNGICTERFRWNCEARRRVREELKLQDAFVVGNIARFIEQKNHSFLIYVFKCIHDLCPNAKLMLIGQGPLEKAVREQVCKLGLEDAVLFMGVRHDVNELLQGMDVFVLPSLFEGLGIVNLEAQAAGLPCFASDKVVPEEVKITDLMHFIPLEQSPEAWARTILEHRISEEDRKDYSKAVRAAGFDIQATTAWLCDFYRGVLRHE